MEEETTLPDDASKKEDKNTTDEQKKSKPIAEPTIEEAKKSEYDLSSSNGIIRMFLDNSKDDVLKYNISIHLLKLITKHKVSEYNIVFYFDEYTKLLYSDADRIYQALNTFPAKKDILLLLSNNGGSIEPAFLISQTCKKYSKNKFIVSIPRRAKSAATLLALGADEIHMGYMSELGPIDPQIDGLPALGLGNSLEYIAKVVSKFPNSSNMFSQYLSSKLDLSVLGYFERVSESATQYAERLVGNKKLPEGKSALDIAQKLVYHYKDHSFVIDLEESKALLGDDFIKENTVEYSFSNDVYNFFKSFNNYVNIFLNKEFTFIGNIANGMNLYDKRKD